MSAWRRKALALFPHHRDEFEAPNCDLHQVFFRLYADAIAVHLAADSSAPSETYLRKVHGFAEWCLHQGGDLWRHAAIGFYEDLFNGSGIPWPALVPWISPYAAEQIEQTWALGPEGERREEFRALLRERSRDAYKTHVATTGEIDSL